MDKAERDELLVAFKRASRIIGAQEKLLMAYRIGSNRAPGTALDLLAKEMPKHVLDKETFMRPAARTEEEKP